ncbi:MAG: hypothetical protein A4E52_01125 [Pelotomaculum sp. PtaB.Bin013]|nr:MAG: hypothetical protein A4E52_01125 [Pelotomaculum sp. PtaB.Bin013]
MDKNHALFIGKAGEMAVVSELLFRGFNANILAVDYGADVIALKNNKVYQVQVKTRTLSSRNKVLYQFRKDTFDELNQQGYYVVLVIRDEEGINDYIIMPGNTVSIFIAKGWVEDYKDIWRMWIGLRESEEGKKVVFMRRISNTITEYLNNWDLIK